MHRKLIALLFAFVVLLGNHAPANSATEEGLWVEEQVEEVVVQQEEPKLSYRERLDVQVSRGEVRAINMSCIAYTHTGNPTALGIMPYVGVVAVDPNVIPLGTHVYVEGYGEAIAADTGVDIVGHIMDLFMDTEDECLNWGRQTRKVYILGR